MRCLSLVLVMAGFLACGGSEDAPTQGGSSSGNDGPSSGDGGSGSSSGSGTDGGASSSSGDTEGGVDAGPSPPSCTPPVTLIDVGVPTTKVGNGTPASCTEQAFGDAVAAGGIVTFDCGAAPFTLSLTSEKVPPLDQDTVIDGGGTITLDGGDATRILNFTRGDFRTSSRTLTLQRLRLAHGKAPGGGYVAPNPGNAACAYGYATGGGGAVLVRDNKLVVIDCVFEDNAAASPGPDVGGGAIYALGSLGVTVVGSRFERNSGSNAGAIGLLQTEGTLVNSVFSQNHATGTGANYANGAAAGCPGVGHENQGGAGGNGGAMAIDGSAETDQIFCGVRFDGNTANELAGAVFRTNNVEAHRTAIDRSTFVGNVAKAGGALYLRNSKPLEIHASTFAYNEANGGGMAQLDECTLDVVNTTIYGNVARTGLGGGLTNYSGTTGTFRNVTFAENKAEAGPGIFSAAIAGQMNFQMYNTLFANNLTKDAGSPMSCGFTSASGANDMQWPKQRAVGGNDDVACVTGITFADPQVGAFDEVTGTAAVAATSPARGLGRDCPATDQRGQPRAAQTCTLGAVE